MHAAAAMAVAATIVLALRDTIHGWVEALSWAEIRSALVILAMTCIVLPLVPDQSIDRPGRKQSSNGLDDCNIARWRIVYRICRGQVPRNDTRVGRRRSGRWFRLVHVGDRQQCEGGARRGSTVSFACCRRGCSQCGDVDPNLRCAELLNDRLLALIWPPFAPRRPRPVIIVAYSFARSGGGQYRIPTQAIQAAKSAFVHI